MLSGMGHPHERAFYRVVFPRFLRPNLRIGNESYPVVDLSEHGVRFMSPLGGGDLPIGARIVGVIHLPTEQPVDVEGIVVRRVGNEVAVALARGVPFGVMLDQQRFLQQRVLGFR